MAIKKIAEDFATGFMGGNYRVTPATKAGKGTRTVLNKSLKGIASGISFLAKRNPLIATAGVVAGAFEGAGMLTEKIDKKMNEGQPEDTTDVPDYLTSSKSDYKKDYKSYWERTLGHKGVPKREDFNNLGDGYDPEQEFSQAMRLYLDSKPL